jgi:hypothetical protein
MLTIIILPSPFFHILAMMEGAVFDFSRAREISRKITIEDDPVKIDKLLSNLHEIVSKEFENSQMKHSRRTNAASLLNSTTHEEQA